MKQASERREIAIEGTGLCPEAQADGVPCVGTATPCAACAKAGSRVCRCQPAPGNPDHPELEW
ncbi:MAG: hypothetical protein U0166_26520 [Acidobacteriota bacterium]